MKLNQKVTIISKRSVQNAEDGLVVKNSPPRGFTRELTINNMTHPTPAEQRLREEWMNHEIFVGGDYEKNRLADWWFAKFAERKKEILEEERERIIEIINDMPEHISVVWSSQIDDFMKELIRTIQE